jgi:hypothetical protein
MRRIGSRELKNRLGITHDSHPKEYPEFACGEYRLLESDRTDAIFAHACEDEEGNAVLAIHNFSREPVKTKVRLWN